MIRERRAKAEVTAFLGLIFILLISFAGSMMESASLQMAKNYRRTDVNRAMESVFAEFQRELLEEFDIFGLDGSYETGTYAENQLTGRMNYYGASGIEQRITRIQFLTDHSGKAFQQQAGAYMLQKYGLESVDKWLGTSGTWQVQEEGSMQCQKEEALTGENLEAMLSEQEAELPVQDNPLPNISKLKEGPLLSLVMPRDKPVSEKRISLSDTVSGRRLNTGYGTFGEETGPGEASKLLFGSYLLEHFICAVPETGGAPPAGGVLDYELEYILNGKSSDRANLEGVANKLILLRLAPNYGYLLSDKGKQAEAEVLAIALCTAVGFVAAAEVVKQALLFAWAYGESVMDVRSLLDGSRVPPVKSSESWQLSLSGLLTLGTEEDRRSGADIEGGMSYRDYLRVLLLLKSTDGLSCRGLDMIEQRLRVQKGLSWFRADSCISKLETESICRLRRGITYKFRTSFGYC